MDNIIMLGQVIACLLITACIPSKSVETPPIQPAIEENPTIQTQLTIEKEQPAVYYVRTDGASPEHCDGLVDAAYPGQGTGQACAWDHPFRALPPYGTPVLAGGDTLIISSGDYRIGIGAPGDDECEADYSWECTLPPIPAGTESQPTRILGAGWDTGCKNPPELWGAERANQIINLSGSDNVEIGCLEITDHSNCIEAYAEDAGGTELTCERDNPPFGDWAAVGIFAQDAANLHLVNLNIHGLSNTGVHAGGLADLLVENVRIAGNGWAGWDGDMPEGNISNSGNLVFQNWTVEWNGCSESWPDQQYGGCWGQSAGGYGDGVGTGETGGNWIIEDSAFLHNTSDGLDLLYHTLGGSITLNRVWAEGNAGNQVKVTGNSVITNSLLVGNCAFFQDQPFTYDVDHCRALGNTLEIVFTGGEKASIINSTIYGQGDGLVGGGPREGYSCTGDERIQGQNNIFQGDEDFNSQGDVTFLFYQEECADLKFESDYNIFFYVKDFACGLEGDYSKSGPNDYCTDPRFVSLEEYNLALGENSPAVDTGNGAICPPVDLFRHKRPSDGNEDGLSICDRGAIERYPMSARIYLPITVARKSSRT